MSISHKRKLYSYCGEDRSADRGGQLVPSRGLWQQADPVSHPALYTLLACTPSDNNHDNLAF